MSLYNKGHEARDLPMYCSDSLSSYHGEILSTEQRENVEQASDILFGNVDLLIKDTVMRVPRRAG